MKSDAERQRVIQCLEAAIQRRVSEVRTRTSRLTILVRVIINRFMSLLFFFFPDYKLPQLGIIKTSFNCLKNECST